MESYIKKYYYYIEKVKQLSKSTLESYLRDLKIFDLFLQGKNITQIEDIDDVTIITYMMHLKKIGKSDATISRNISTLRSFFQYLINEGFISKNPMMKVENPQRIKKENKPISIEKVELLLEQPDGTTAIGKRDRAMLELIYASGMKVSEVIQLNIDDIDAIMGYVKCQSNGKVRVIPIGNMAKKSIVEYVNFSRLQFVKDEEKALFVNYSGGRLSRQGFWKIIKKYSEQAGIEETITPHSLRRAFAVHLLQNGADIYSVKEMMGHEDIQSTQYYQKMISDDKKSVYEKAHPRA